MASYVVVVRINMGGWKKNFLVADTLEELHDLAGRLCLPAVHFNTSSLGVPAYPITISFSKFARAYGAKVMKPEDLQAFVERFKKEHHLDRPTSNHPSREKP